MTKHGPLQQDMEYIFSRTNVFSKALDGKTIFVTGGTGFIGKWILEYFTWLNQNNIANLKIIVLSRDPSLFLEKYPSFNNGLISFIEGDVIHFKLRKSERIDFIIHAAADADAKINNEQPLKMIDTIVEGTRRILDLSISSEANKVLFLSSGAVYGNINPAGISFAEDYQGAPNCLETESAYGEGKRLAELYCSIYNKQYKTDVIIARCFAFTGPYLPLDKHFAIGNFIGNALKGEDIIIRGDGKPLRSYMYAADLIVWLLYCLFRGKAGQAYNVGSEKYISIKDLAMEVASFFPQLAVKVLGQTSPLDRNYDYIPDTGKIRSELAVPDILDLKESIRRTIDFYLA